MTNPVGTFIRLPGGTLDIGVMPAPSRPEAARWPVWPDDHPDYWADPTHVAELSGGCVLVSTIEYVPGVAGPLAVRAFSAPVWP